MSVFAGFLACGFVIGLLFGFLVGLALAAAVGKRLEQMDAGSLGQQQRHAQAAMAAVQQANQPPPAAPGV
jgi:sensor histidine kinase regulating citrate/malate metabolism